VVAAAAGPGELRCGRPARAAARTCSTAVSPVWMWPGHTVAAGARRPLRCDPSSSRCGSVRVGVSHFASEGGVPGGGCIVHVGHGGRHAHGRLPHAAPFGGREVPLDDPAHPVADQLHGHTETRPVHSVLTVQDDRRASAWRRFGRRGGRERGLPARRGGIAAWGTRTAGRVLARRGRGPGRGVGVARDGPARSVFFGSPGQPLDLPSDGVRVGRRVEDTFDACEVSAAGLANVTASYAALRRCREVRSARRSGRGSSDR